MLAVVAGAAGIWALASPWGGSKVDGPPASEVASTPQSGSDRQLGHEAEDDAPRGLRAEEPQRVAPHADEPAAPPDDPQGENGQGGDEQSGETDEDIEADLDWLLADQPPVHEGTAGELAEGERLVEERHAMRLKLLSQGIRPEDVFNKHAD